MTRSVASGTRHDALCRVRDASCRAVGDYDWSRCKDVSPRERAKSFLATMRGEVSEQQLGKGSAS